MELKQRQYKTISPLFILLQPFYGTVSFAIAYFDANGGGVNTHSTAIFNKVYYIPICIC